MESTEVQSAIEEASRTIIQGFPIAAGLTSVSNGELSPFVQGISQLGRITSRRRREEIRKHEREREIVGIEGSWLLDDSAALRLALHVILYATRY